MVEEIRIGDVVATRKQHPCGANEWTVIRTGADIKMRCSGCGRVVMLEREAFLKRRKKIISRGAEPELTPELLKRLRESEASRALYPDPAADSGDE